MRACPTVDGTAPPLITHRIGVDTCFSRQECNYHKCHRCIYRGKPANWEPAVVLMPAADVPAAGARQAPAKMVPVPRKKTLAPAAPRRRKTSATA